MSLLNVFGRILKISHTTVYYGVKEWDEEISLPQKGALVVVIESDEIHTHTASKKHFWVWIAVDRFGK